MLTSAPFGLRVIYHPSGNVRMENLPAGIVSGYGTSIFTGTPIKRDTNGTIIPCTTGADSCIGIFAGCQFSSAGRRFILPYWPAGQSYDTGSMIAQWEAIDPYAILEGQANGSLAATTVGEGINLADASAGSTYTGISSQALNATVTGATAATFQIVGLSEYPNNEWGDAYTMVRVKISTVQGQVA